MLGSLRAELLVLRKSKVAWVLVLTAPLLTLVTTYLYPGLLRAPGGHDPPARHLVSERQGDLDAGRFSGED